jgi:homocitrate synthase NifV
MGLRSIPPPSLLFDTTLRDGEQAPGVALTPWEKSEYIHLAELTGIRYIEIGFPENDLDYAACEAAVTATRYSRLSAMSLITKEGVKRVAGLGVHEILFVVPCSTSHLKHVYGRSLDELIGGLSDCIPLARKFGLAVNIGLEDASEFDIPVISKIFNFLKTVATDIDCITIPDTRGQLVPTQTQNLLAFVRRLSARQEWRLAFHAHNDLGLATANSLAALELSPPIDCLHVTICGFGERAGNASLEQVAVLAEKKMGMRTTLDLRKLRSLAELAAEIFLTPIYPHAPILGGKVFSHESGLHQRGLLNDNATYQYLDPSEFGAETTLILGKHSGRYLRRAIAERVGCGGEKVSELQRSLATRDKALAKNSIREFMREYSLRSCQGLELENAVSLLQSESATEGEFNNGE